MAVCASCHGLEHVSVEKKVGPSLGLVYNRKAGSDVLYHNYSETLVKSDKYWTPKNLYRFMYNPSVFMKGTTCGARALKSEEDRADLIEFLREFSKEMWTNLKIREVKQKSYIGVQSGMYADEQARRRVP
jgi:cytochrome c